MSSPISKVWNDPSHRFNKCEEIIPPYTWVEVTTGAPHISGCTLNSDYTFDPSACWKVPPPTIKTVLGPEPKAYVSEIVLILRGNQCDHGQTELKTTQSDTNPICTTTVKDPLMSFYEQASIIDMSTNDYVDRYWTICVPPSLKGISTWSKFVYTSLSRNAVPQRTNPFEYSSSNKQDYIFLLSTVSSIPSSSPSRALNQYRHDTEASCNIIGRITWSQFSLVVYRWLQYTDIPLPGIRRWTYSVLWSAIYTD